MKAILEFNLPEDADDHSLAVQANNMHSILWDVRQEIFRPARKHGYSNPVLQGLIATINEKCAGSEVSAEDLIYELELKFNELIATHNFRGDV